MSLSSQKYTFGIRDPEKSYSVSRIRVKKAPDPGSGSATPVVETNPVGSSAKTF
jgi:hypothetical protein